MKRIYELQIFGNAAVTILRFPEHPLEMYSVGTVQFSSHYKCTPRHDRSCQHALASRRRFRLPVMYYYMKFYKSFKQCGVYCNFTGFLIDQLFSTLFMCIVAAHLSLLALFFCLHLVC